MVSHYTIAVKYCPGSGKNYRCLSDVIGDLELRSEGIWSQDEDNCILKVGVAYSQLSTYSPDVLLVSS